MVFMCRPLSPGINWIVPSLPLKAQKASNSFILHMVLWPVILINYIWIHHVVSMGYAAPHCIFGDQMVLVAEALPAVVTFFLCSETCLLHF